MTQQFKLSDNDLCGTVPDPVATMGAGMGSGYDVTTNTFLGAASCPTTKALTSLYVHSPSYSFHRPSLRRG